MTGFALQLITIFVALAAAIFAWRLDRRLSAFRSGQADMAKTVLELAAATQKAEAAVNALKTEGASVSKELEAQITAAKNASDELQVAVSGRRPKRQSAPVSDDPLADILNQTR